MPAGLYVHIPFCIKKCNYCDFCSVTYDEDLANNYIDALIKEYDLISKKYDKIRFDTVYIGGGTPSILTNQNLKKLINAIFKSGKVDLKEFTIEVNPSSNVDFKFYKSLGINRVSVGVQSLNDDILKFCGRTHDSKTALKTLQAARENFDKVSADLILGLCGDSKKILENNLFGIFPYVNHISMYILKLSKNVPMYKLIPQLPDDEFTADLYDFGYSIMQNNAFNRYEISNFALNYNNNHIKDNAYDNNISHHNMKYWTRDNYIGIGASAHSFIDGTRYANNNDINKYILGQNCGKSLYNMQIITNEEALFEEIMLRLRLEKGLDIDLINKKYNIDFLQKYQKAVLELKDYLTMKDNMLSIKPQYMLLQNQIILKFV